MTPISYSGDPRFVVVPPQIRMAYKALQYMGRIKEGAWTNDGTVQVIEGRKLSTSEEALWRSANQALIRYFCGEDYCTMTPPEVHNRFMIITPEQGDHFMSQLAASNNQASGPPQAPSGFIDTPPDDEEPDDDIPFMPVPRQ